MAEAQGSSALFSRDGKLSAQELVPMALQHVVAAVVGIITPAIIVANLCHLPADQKTLLIQVSLVMSGLVTLVQAHPLFGGRFGSGLPVIMGTSFAYVPTLSAVGVQFGIGAILGAEIIGGAVAVLFALCFRKIKSLFPSVVTGTVVLCIGISLYTVAVGYMAGGSSSPTFGSAQNWLVALVTLVACVYFANFGKGVFKLGSLLFGMLVGYVLALALGMVSYDAVVASSWFELPHFMPFAIKFVPASIASITIVFIVASLETIGNFTGATVGGMDREPNVQELTGGLVSQGIMTMVGAFFGAMPTSSFGQNVGIVTQTRVINRRVFSTAAIILIAAGLMPKLAAVLSGIPQAVIGGATINVFGTISMTGIRMLTKDGLTPRPASPQSSTSPTRTSTSPLPPTPRRMARRTTTPSRRPKPGAGGAVAQQRGRTAFLSRACAVARTPLPCPHSRSRPTQKGPAHHARGPRPIIRAAAASRQPPAAARYSWPAARFASSM